MDSKPFPVLNILKQKTPSKRFITAGQRNWYYGRMQVYLNRLKGDIHLNRHLLNNDEFLEFVEVVISFQKLIDTKQENWDKYKKENAGL